jgi:capsid protein
MLLKIAPIQSIKSAMSWTASAACAPFRWGYDAINSSNKRQGPTGVLRSEDAELQPTQRAKLLSAGRDLHRNFALLGWAVRKHLDYTSTFVFQAKGKREEANSKIEKFVKKWSQPENFDICARHGLDRFIRMSEEARLLDGDILIAKLKSGHVQAIEGDRLRTPLGQQFDWQNNERMVAGVVINDYGRSLSYAVSRRGAIGPLLTQSTTFVFERMIEAKDAILHAYYTRFDQTRGISPLAPAYIGLRDLYESFDYALAKMKVSQLLGLVIYSDSQYPTGETTPNAPNTLADGSDGTPRPKYKVALGKDPFKMELEGKDRAEFIESRNPSTEFQSFAQSMISLVLKAIDIPYSFYAENFSNYSGSRQALLQYEQSAEQRRKENRDLLNHLTAWRLKKAIDENDPDLAGVTTEDLAWEWVASALPWIDPMKAVAANSAGVDRGFTSTPRVCKEQGLDAFEVAKEQADYEVRVKNYRESLGLPGIPASNPVTYMELAGNGTSNNTTAA